MYDLIIFDCDGTLVDSEELNARATVEIFAEAGFPQYTVDLVEERFLGMKFGKVIELLERENAIKFPDDMAARFVAAVARNSARYLHPVDGAKALVDAVAASGTKFCVGSNGEYENIKASLVAAGLKPYFPDEIIFNAAMVPHPKPAPDLFLLAAEKMGAAPEKTLVIEDSVTGATAGLRAGMEVFGFVGVAPHPEKQKKALEKAGVNHIFDSLIHILETLNP